MEDVIIIGGGPVGMICALGLAQAGVRVSVIEAEPRIVDSPRAAVYFWSVLDGLGRLGILQEAETVGVRKQDYTYLVRRSGERIVYSMEILTGHTPHPYNLHLGQHRLADIAMRRLKTFPNATVRFGTRLHKLQQDAGGVTLSATTERSTEELRASWVIGADGAGSTVRRLLGLSFDGMTWPERFVATNVYYDFERHGYARATFVIDESFGAVIAVLNNEGLWRCTYMEDATLPEETFLERLPQMYQAILPGEGSYQLERASPYRMHQRSAPRYRVGRVLLAGDAAHVTNPTGGLGLTSGLFDSYALYPALAAVILEGADHDVLDRYSATRRDIFLERVSPQATANKQLIYHANGGGRKLEEALASLRRLATDREFLWQRLMFTRSLETPPPRVAPRTMSGMNSELWPALPYAAWQDTYATLHMWSQIVGKIALALAPPINHSWGISLHLTARGLVTRNLPHGGRLFSMEFDFIDHQLVIRTTDGDLRALPLNSRSVAQFYREVMDTLRSMALPVTIWSMPVEVPAPIRFEDDTVHHSYDPEFAQRFWRILLQVERVLTDCRCQFIGKCSPVQFFWGSFDLAVSRFSGAPAPARDGPEFMRDAYSHAVISHGFWPGSGPVPEAAFYAYCVPEPTGLKRAPIQPAAASYHSGLNEFVLPYEAVRTAASPEQAIHAFVDSTYDQAATLAGWNRAALEKSAVSG